jgi:hypothetical protein
LEITMKQARAVLGFVLAAGLALGACSDRGITPPAGIDRGGEQSSLLGGLLSTAGDLLFSPLQRNTPLAQDVSWTFTVGPSGGYSTNSAVGLAIAIPPNAVWSTKTITVTALAGSPVAYRFEPHIEFNKKIYLTQDLQKTSSGLLGSLAMKAAHFPGFTPVYTSAGLAVVDEIVSGLVLPWSKTFTFGVNHFSGWIAGTGYMSESSSEGQ